MGKIAAYLLAGIGVGVGFAWWQGIGQPSAGIGSGIAIEDRAPLENRLSELETDLALERFERQALADELEALKLAIDAMPAAGEGAEGQEDPRERMAARLDNAEEEARREAMLRERFPNGVPQTPEERAAYQRQRQLDAYIAAGLTPARAQWIMQREDEVEMEVLQARFEATQREASQQEIANINAAQILRKELGDADYEKYLQGQGRPTTIGVNEVLINSPAQIAGLQPGDEIVAYNGQRVFDMNELNSLTYEAPPGSNVALQVVRDGQTMQVYVESGPIGISGGGRSTRREGNFGGPGAGGRGAPPGAR